MKKDLSIQKSNKLIESRKDIPLSSREKKLVAYMLACVSPFDNDAQQYQFPIKEFAEHFEIEDKNLNQEYLKLAKNIIKKPFTINTKEKDIVLSWISDATFDKTNKQLRFRFSPELKPYIIQLKHSYTQYQLSNLIYFECCHSETIYELLKQYERIGWREITISKIRPILGVQKKYPLYANFKKKVLSPSVEEINKYTDINIEVKEIKHGKKVHSLRFSIDSDPYNQYVQKARKQKPIYKNLQKEFTAPKHIPEEDRLLVEKLASFAIKIEQSLYFINNYSPEYIYENLKIVEDRIRIGEENGNLINNIPSYTIKALEEDYRPKKAKVLQKIQRKKQENLNKEQDEIINEYLEKYYRAWYHDKIKESVEKAKESQELMGKFETYLLGKKEYNFILKLFKRKKFKDQTSAIFFEEFIIREKDLEKKYPKTTFITEEQYLITEDENNKNSLYKSNQKII